MIGLLVGRVGVRAGDACCWPREVRLWKSRWTWGSLRVGMPGYGFFGVEGRCWFGLVLVWAMTQGRIKSCRSLRPTHARISLYSTGKLLIESLYSTLQYS